MDHDFNGDGKGARASLTGGANLGGDHAAVISSVRVQAAIDGSSNGLYQFGWLKQGSSANSDCTDGSFSGGFAERHYDNLTGNYICNPYNGLGNYGDDYKFSIKHVGSGWEAIKQNGDVLEGPVDLNFPGRFVFAVSEKYHTVTSMNMFFGPSGETDWQRWDGNSWETIHNADKFNEGGGWSVGNPPSPFSISR
jgi:hypothetical protein